MPRIHEPRASQLPQYLSVRLSSEELKRLRATLRNLQIPGSCLSVQMRLFLRESYFRSLRVRRSRERIQMERDLSVVPLEDPEGEDPEE